MQTLIDIAVPLITFAVLLVVGTDLSGADFSRVLRRPGVLVAGLLAPYLVLPALALGLVWLLEPPEASAVGLLLVTACPIGGISNTYSYLARASPALSVTLTATSCLLAAATIPLVSGALERFTAKPLDFVAPLGVVVPQLLLMLLAPVALGMAARQRWPTLVTRHKGSLQAAGFAGLALLLAAIIALDLPLFLAGLGSTVSLAAAFVAGSFLAGWTVGRAFAAGPRDCFTLAAEFATRNVAIAITIAVTLLRRVEFATFATTYFLVEVLLLSCAVTVFRRLVAERDSPGAPGSDRFPRRGRDVVT